MTTDDLLALVKSRGLRVVLQHDGGPALRGPEESRPEATPKLLAALGRREHREEIIRRLRLAGGALF